MNLRVMAKDRSVADSFMLLAAFQGLELKLAPMVHIELFTKA